MFRVTIDDVEARVTFQHDRWYEHEHGAGMTECFIFCGGEQQPWYEAHSIGTAFCSSKDPFCYETGRRVALTDALRNGRFSREDRTKFWNAYWATKLGANWPRKRVVRCTACRTDVMVELKGTTYYGKCPTCGRDIWVRREIYEGGD